MAVGEQASTARSKPLQHTGATFAGVWAGFWSRCRVDSIKYLWAWSLLQYLIGKGISCHWMLNEQAPLAQPPQPFTAYSDSLNVCLLKCWLGKGVCVCVCVCVKGKGRGISFNTSPLLSDSLSSHIYSVSPFSLFLSYSLFLLPVLSVLCHFFLSHVRHTCSFQCSTWSYSHGIIYSLVLSFIVSFLLPIRSSISCSVFGIFGWCFSITAGVCYIYSPGSAHCVRNQLQTEVGVFGVSSLGLRLHVSGLSIAVFPLPLSPFFLAAALLTLVCQWVRMIVLICL